MVQVVYSLLAASFLIGFVIFGVGSGGIGSISDLFGSGGGGSASSAYDSQIANAQSKLKKDPKDVSALHQLAYYEILASGIQNLDPNDPTLDSDSQSDLARAFDAWTRYVKLVKQPDLALAQGIAQAYAFTGDLPGAVRAQRIYADAQPNSSSLGQLAIYMYFNGDFEQGDKVADEAVAKAPGSTRRTAKRLLAQRRQVAKRYVKVQNAQAKASQGAGGGAVQNPFGGPAPTPTPTSP